MAGLVYVGAAPSDVKDVGTRGSVETTLTSGVSRAYVDGRVADLMVPKATKTYVDTQDSLYADAGYPATQDVALVPLTAKGTANGVATLDGSGKVTSSQVPVLGAGIMKGPWGYNNQYGGSTNDIPFRIAEWNLGVTGVGGQPLVYFNTSVLATGCRPIIEIRIGNSTQTTYAAQTLIATGYGFSGYADYQIVTCFPADPDLSESQDGIQDTMSPATNYLVNAWMFADVSSGTVAMTSGAVISGAVFFARTTL